MRVLDQMDFLVIALFQARLDDVSRAAGDLIAAHFVSERFDTHWHRIDVRGFTSGALRQVAHMLSGQCSSNREPRRERQHSSPISRTDG